MKRHAVNLLWFLASMAVAGLLVYACTGCHAVPTSDGSGTVYALGLTSEDIEGAGPFVPGPLKALLPLALLAFPKFRDNLVTAVAPSTPSEQRAPALLSAAIPYFNSPPATRERQARRKAKKEQRA